MHAPCAAGAGFQVNVKLAGKTRGARQSRGRTEMSDKALRMLTVPCKQAHIRAAQGTRLHPSMHSPAALTLKLSTATSLLHARRALVSSTGSAAD